MSERLTTTTASAISRVLNKAKMRGYAVTSGYRAVYVVVMPGNSNTCPRIINQLNAAGYHSVVYPTASAARLDGHHGDLLDKIHDACEVIAVYGKRAAFSGGVLNRQSRSRVAR